MTIDSFLKSAKLQKLLEKEFPGFNKTNGSEGYCKVVCEYIHSLFNECEPFTGFASYYGDELIQVGGHYVIKYGNNLYDFTSNQYTPYGLPKSNGVVVLTPSGKNTWVKGDYMITLEMPNHINEAKGVALREAQTDEIRKKENKTASEAEEGKMKCKLCGEEIKGYGNNGEPLVSGKVCNNCNWKVIQERIKQSRSNEDTFKEELPSRKEILQSEVDFQLVKFGRIGGRLYDELDEAGYYLDENNKVQSKVKESNESLAVTGTDGPVPVTDPCADFERYAKEFEETFILGKTPIRKEVAKNKIKVKDGELVGEVDSIQKEEKMEQPEVVKPSTESLINRPLKNDEIFEVLRMAKELKLKTIGDLERILKDYPGSEDPVEILKEELYGKDE